MSTFAVPQGRLPAVAGSRGVASAAILLARRVGRALKARRDRRHLEALPDYLLGDIGISRSEIGSAVKFGRSRRTGPALRA